MISSPGPDRFFLFSGSSNRLEVDHIAVVMFRKLERLDLEKSQIHYSSPN